jgi:hypothetical protein
VARKPDEMDRLCRNLYRKPIQPSITDNSFAMNSMIEQQFVADRA